MHCMYAQPASFGAISEGGPAGTDMPVRLVRTSLVHGRRIGLVFVGQKPESLAKKPGQALSCPVTCNYGVRTP